MKFENYLYYYVPFKQFTTNFHMSIDSGTITVGSDANNKIKFDYKLKFTKSYFVILLFVMLFNFLFKLPFFSQFLVAAGAQLVFIFFSIQKMKWIISDCLKNRYR